MNRKALDIQPECDIIDTYEKQTRKDAQERERGRCLLCNRRGADVHEIIPKSRFGKLNMQDCFDIKNRVLLCRLCHEKAHTIEIRKRLLFIMKNKYGYSYEESIYEKYLEN